jgi:3-dehydroquinate synthase
MTHIFLYGPPGSGKSTVGRALAGNLHLPFIDIDRVIEEQAGLSIPQIMDNLGESGFRNLESATLKGLKYQADSVIALGGGALVHGGNRSLVEGSGPVIVLTAELSTLLARLENDPLERPLLSGDVRTSLSSLLDARREHYQTFPLSLPVDGMTPVEVALHAQFLLGRFHLSVMGGCDVLVKHGGLDGLGEILRAHGARNPIIVTDENVAKFHVDPARSAMRASGFNPGVLTIPAGEAGKNLHTVTQLWHGFLKAGLDRNDTVIALGGGVVGDLAGFAASTFMRGIQWLAVPTTLLAMVDASLGGKTGFDLPEGKNLIGSFHSPTLVLEDQRVLGTLPEREFISGLAEVVKHGIISDPHLFMLCASGMSLVRERQDEIIKRAMAVKIEILEADPYEKGLRAVLNLGHTVGHAVELVSGYTLTHGESVAIGMVAETKYASRMGLAEAGLADRVSATLAGLGLPVDIPGVTPRKEIVRAMQGDKKRHARAVQFALPVGIGKVQLVDVTDLDSVLE